MSGPAHRSGPGVLGRPQIRHLYPVIAVALYPFLAAGPIRDNSFLWHVRAGTAQFDLGRVLDVDIFSWTHSGEVWLTQSWLAELAYAGLEGITGTVYWAPALVGVVGVSTLAMVGVAIYGSSRSTLVTAMWLLIAVWLAGPFAHPRPVIFSYLLLAGLVLIVRVNDRLLWAAVPLVWIWAAVHGSWLIGIALLVLEAIRRRSWRVASLAGLCAAGATFTAHGLGVWEIVVRFAANRDALEFLGEWGSPDFGEVVQGPYVLVLAGIIVAAVRGRIALSDLWVVLPFLFLGLTMERTVFPAAIVLLPYAAQAYEIEVPASPRRSAGLTWIVGALIVMIAAGYVALSDTGFDEERFPSDEVLVALTTDRFFHDDATGGYLIYRDWPDQAVYIDDRAELYGAAGFAGLQAARQGAYEDLFAELGLTEAVVKPTWPLRTRLERDGWTLVMEDEFFAVMRR